MTHDTQDIIRTLHILHGRGPVTIKTGDDTQTYEDPQALALAIAAGAVADGTEFLLNDGAMQWLAIRIKGLGAATVVRNISRDLASQGFPAPVTGEVASDRTLFYKMEETTPDNAKAMLKRATSILGLDHDDTTAVVQTCDADLTVPLYGMTGSRLGDVPEHIEPLSYSHLARWIKATSPETPEDDKTTNYDTDSFDLKAMLDEHLPGDISYTTQTTELGTSYLLTHCVHDEKHKTARFSITTGGKLGYYCADCDKGYDAARRKINPTPEEQEADRRSEIRKLTNAQLKANGLFYVPGKDAQSWWLPKEESKAWLSPKDIRALKRPERSFISTGNPELDGYLGGGLCRGTVTIELGLMGCGKSTLNSQIAAHAIEAGNRVLVYSGELDRYDFMDWFYLQAAGPGYIQKEPGGRYIVPEDVKDAIDDWSEGKLALYNNDFGTNYRKLIPEIDVELAAAPADLIILDNMFFMEVGGSGATEAQGQWNEQTAFMKWLHELAQKYRIAILLVTHPNRSAQTICRRWSIQGAANILNAAETIMIIHRTDDAFRTAVQDHTGKYGMSAWEEDDPRLSADNLVEIAKSRFSTCQGSWARLRYDPTSLRLLPMDGKHPRFGWLHCLPHCTKEEYIAAYDLIASGHAGADEVSEAQHKIDRYEDIYGAVDRPNYVS